MSYLQTILDADDIKPLSVDCPEWGLSVWVLPFDGLLHDEHDREWIQFDDAGKLVRRDGQDAWVVGKSLCTAEGERLNPTAEQLRLLNRKCAAPIVRIARAVYEASGLRESQREKERKNLESTPCGDSG